MTDDNLIQRSSHVTTDNDVPNPPFWGTKCIENISLRAILPYLNKTTLYRFQWGFKAQGKNQEEYQVYAKQELDPILNRLVKQSEDEKILQPQAIYGYFPCQSEGNDLIVYHDLAGTKERCRFTFPRQTTERRLCVSDFFKSVESEKMDVLALQVVTVGQSASDHARSLFSKDQYQEYLYWHGLNAEGAEALAEYIHKRIRVELGFGKEDSRDLTDLIKQKYRGSRYSFGYPACPNLQDQDKILDLLDANRIHVTLGDEAQLEPEESTTAIIAHHPSAKYFGV